MSTYEEIVADSRAALKAGDARKREVLGTVLSALKNAEIEARAKGTPFSDSDATTVLRKLKKQSEESLEAAKTAERADLVEKFGAELEVITGYLPAELSPDALAGLVETVIAELSASSMKDMGKVMAEIGKRAPNADRGAVSGLVKARLSAA